MSRPLRPVLEIRAVSTLVWAISTLIAKVAPYPSRAQGYFLGRAVFVSVWKIAASPSWFEKMRRLCFGLESCAASTLLWAISTLIAKVAPYPPRSQGIFSWSRRLRLGLESDAVSTLVWKVAPYPQRLRGNFSWSRRLRVGLESSALSALF